MPPLRRRGITIPVGNSAHRVAALEGRTAQAQENRHVAAGRIGGDEVGGAIAVEVGDGDEAAPTGKEVVATKLGLSALAAASTTLSDLRETASADTIPAALEAICTAIGMGGASFRVGVLDDVLQVATHQGAPPGVND